MVKRSSERRAPWVMPGLGVPAVIAFAVLGSVAGTAGAAAGAATSEVGAAVYASSCAGCHGPDGAGVPGAFPPLANNPNATDPSYVAEVVTQGRSGPIEVLGTTYDGMMPAFANLSSDEVAAVADYVAALASGTSGASGDTSPDPEPTETPATTVPAAPPEAGDTERGRDIFIGTQRLANGGPSCASCHSVGDIGMLGRSGLGPDLTASYQRLGGEAGLSAWLATPGSPTMQPLFADRPLTDQEINDLVAVMADAENQQAAGRTDWLVLGGLAGLVILLAGMAALWRNIRQPYSTTLTSRSTR